MSNDHADWLPEVIRIAERVGHQILPYFGLSSQELTVQKKPDHTVLITADLEAHQTILEGLTHLSPKIPVLSEEGEIPDYEIRRHWSQYWLVDPLDGSLGFSSHCPEFSVNIALIENQRPVLGVVYIPTIAVCYFSTLNQGAFKQDPSSPKPMPIRTRALDMSSFSILLGRYLRSENLIDLFKSLEGAHIVRLNSSLKFCWLAEGRADCYPRIGETYEWDTAAAQCILEEAGGIVVDFNGKSLQYNAKSSLVNPPFLAMGDPNQKKSFIQMLKKLAEEPPT
jgi:3'(2'), 5'-bisphosphate nucleotidase